MVRKEKTDKDNGKGENWGQKDERGEAEEEFGKRKSRGEKRVEGSGQVETQLRREIIQKNKGRWYIIRIKRGGRESGNGNSWGWQSNSKESKTVEWEEE